MKSFFKRSAISLIVLGMAGSANAAITNTASWSPQFTGAFIGVEGLDLRPQNGDLDWIIFSPTTSQAAGPSNARAFSTDYDWAWRVFGGIKFTDNDDITLSWMRMRASEHDSVSANQVAAPVHLTPRWLFTDEWDSASGKVNFDLDNVYGVWGHTVHFNNPWSVRFAAGVEYAKLDSDLTVTSNVITTLPDMASAVQQPTFNLSNIGYTAKSETKGFGPRVEFDAKYGLPYGLALFANTNAALLVAERDISLNPTTSFFLFGDDSELDPSYTFYTSSFSTRHVVVPHLGMRLGVSYTYFFGQAGGEGASCRGTSLTIDAGWQAETYIHAIERPNNGMFEFDSGSNLLTQSSSAVFAGTKVSNFSDQGLFVGITVGSDW